MTKQTRRIGAGIAVLITLVAGRPAAASDGRVVAAAAGTSMPRVRSSSPAITVLMREAAARSATFRGMVQTIDASDGIVYVEHGECRHGVRACLAGVATAGSYRILHIKIHVGVKGQELMGSIAHELRHAVEVLGARSVTDSTTMFLFYTREGHRQGRVFETDAAIAAGATVRAEMRRSMRAAQGR